MLLISAVILIPLLFIVLAAGLWVGLALMFVAGACLLLFEGPLLLTVAQSMWQAVDSWTLTALPLFIWMGEILFRTRIAHDLFTGLTPFVRHFPGGLTHVNVFACGIFSAVSGSSAATAATIGRINLPELAQRGYPDQITIGSLTAAGTLGLLIPPSITLIVYGVTAQVSIGRLFIAGIVPGLLLVFLFSAYVIFWSVLNRSQMPKQEDPTPWKRAIINLRLLIPIICLIAFVMGSIYTGFATPTESAALGIVGALIIAAVSRSLTMTTFLESCIGAVKTTTMILLIMAGAGLLTHAVAFAGIPQALAEFVISHNLVGWKLLSVLVVIYIILGCFLDGISIIVLSAALVLPLITASGYDLLWFGIVLTILIEIAQITPPVGFNLFVVQSISGKSISSITYAVLPFFLLMLFAIVILTMFPSLITWLPQQMYGG